MRKRRSPVLQTFRDFQVGQGIGGAKKNIDVSSDQINGRQVLGTPKPLELRTLGQYFPKCDAWDSNSMCCFLKKGSTFLEKYDLLDIRNENSSLSFAW